MKHKHADLIHAWADGAEIQVLYKTGEWVTEKCPGFVEYNQYRIKPEEKKPVVRWLWAYEVFGGGCEITELLTEDEASKYTLVLVKLEWSRTEFTK